MLLADWDNATNPGEIVRIGAANGRDQRLTDFNVEHASKIDWLPLRDFWHTSKRGKQIHSMIALPPNFDEHKKYPLLVLIHGGAANMWRDQFGIRWNYHLLARSGYVVLLTDYSGSTGYGEAFAQAIERDPLEGPAQEINAAADEAIRRYSFVDGTRQCAGGASYGGHLANWMQASTTRYRCLVSHAGLVDLEAQWGTSDAVYHREVMIGGPPWSGDPLWRAQSPIEYAAKFRTPVLLTIGEHDCWGRGYGGEATALMVDHAFSSLNLHRVALSVFSFNERAVRAYLRVGFVDEGRAREAIWRDGRWWDEIHMSVLEPEWRARRWQERAIAEGRGIGAGRG